MMWAEVVRACVATLQGDSQLSTLLGGSTHIYRNRTRSTIRIPGVYWSVLWGDLAENLAPVSMQWDVFANDATTLAAIELRLYKLMHTDTVMSLNGLLLYSQYQGRYDLHDENQGVAHSALEWKYAPPRHNG